MIPTAIQTSPPLLYWVNQTHLFLTFLSAFGSEKQKDSDSNSICLYTLCRIVRDLGYEDPTLVCSEFLRTDGSTGQDR